MKFHKYQPYKKLKLQASEMPHHAKHHASSIAAIERSLVIRIRDGFEPRRGSVMIIQKGENDTTTDPLRGSYFVHIAITMQVSLHARTLAWCFASFGISDACFCFCAYSYACSCCRFSFPIDFPLSPIWVNW